MAKLAVINRQAKREAVVKKFAEKRKQLLAIIRDPKATDDARDEARAKLQSQPRDASPGGPAGPSASSVSHATRSARSRCAGRSPA